MTGAPILQVAVLATDGVEEAELTQPIQALREARAEVDLISVRPGTIQAFRHHDKSITVEVELTIENTLSDAYGALLLPGGALNADSLRADPRVLAFIRQIQECGKPIAAICHAPWELISAGLVRGRRLTSYHTLRDDVQNAGGEWIDSEVVVDRNWVTGRQPSDIPAFNREMLAVFSKVLSLSPS
ncbi:MAG: type 1 glutamine amidotransferase domain-containing protein [Terriglobia bacterium]